jgi:hypothetical protein
VLYSQFPFVVAAGAVAEELFFRVSIQVKHFESFGKIQWSFVFLLANQLVIYLTSFSLVVFSSRSDKLLINLKGSLVEQLETMCYDPHRNVFDVLEVCGSLVWQGGLAHAFQVSDKGMSETTIGLVSLVRKKPFLNQPKII